jgi:hypothetical protein
MHFVATQAQEVEVSFSQCGLAKIFVCEEDAGIKISIKM